MSEIKSNRKFRFWFEDGHIIVEEKLALSVQGSKNRKWDTQRIEITPEELVKIIRAIPIPE